MLIGGDTGKLSSATAGCEYNPSGSGKQLVRLVVASTQTPCWVLKEQARWSPFGGVGLFWMVIRILTAIPAWCWVSWRVWLVVVGWVWVVVC